MNKPASTHSPPSSSLAAPVSGHKTALTLLFLACALSMADRMILTILFEPIKLEFGLSDTQLGILGGLSFAIFYATLSLPIARLADRSNRVKIILLSLVIFSVTAALCGLATGFVMLVILRIGVGIGEAGVYPASQSILGDYYPPEQRASAMSILSVGANFGMIIGFILGGAVAQSYGWRAALIVVALPGLLLAAIMWLKLKEPERGYFDKLQSKNYKPDDDVQLSIWETAKYLFAIPSYRYLIIACTISGTGAYGLTAWFPSFFLRTHDLSQTEVGAVMAGVFGLVGAIGAVVGGKIIDQLNQRGFQYGVWLIAISQILSIPFATAAYFADALPLAIGLFLFPAFCSMIYLGPSMALIQTIAPVHMRATASSFKMLCLNLIGMSLGPLLIGLFSDYLQPEYGTDSIRVALASASVLGLFSAFFFYRCGRSLLRDLPVTSGELVYSTTNAS